MSEKEECGNCRFYVGENGGAWASCHRRSPRGEKREGWAHRDQGIWPEISSHDWCGDWERAP